MRRLLAIAALSLLLPCASYAQGYRTYTVAGSSMSPTLVPGDEVVVAGLDGRAPERGELVEIRLAGRANPMVKRVAAVPGDGVEVRDGGLYINGGRLCGIDPDRWKPTLRQLENYGWKVPDGTYLIMGDNRANSRDSRRLGLIPAESVTGRVVDIIGHGIHTKRADNEP